MLDPVKLIIDNYPDGTEEELEAINNPEDETQGIRKVPFSKVLYIERDDFMENPPKKYFRLAPGQEVRLRYAYFVKCSGVEKDAKGNIQAIHCTYDPASRGGNSPDGRKVKGTIHWVSVKHAVEAEVRLYDRLFKSENPEIAEEGHDYTENLNTESLKIVKGHCEPFAADAKAGDHLQFERVGYFCADPDSRPGKPVFNRTVTLKDSWAKLAGENI